MTVSPTKEGTQPGAACASAATPARGSWLSYLFPVLAVACWALAIRHLAGDWTFNEQYHYGWLVPLLALYLFRVRFERFPAPGAPLPPAIAWGGLLVAALLLASSLPVREANTDWRLMGWWLAGLAAGVTLLGFAQAGGAAWVRHFAFPVLFFFIAVPVMRPLEDGAMQWLMKHNARLAVEVLHWLGVHGEAKGNLISLPNCTLGVDEACSGVRSLQGTLMLTLFLGELLSLMWSRRLALLATGVAAALVTNVVRTVALALIAARDGLPAVDRWHDSAGYSVMAGCAAVVVLVGWMFRPRVDSPGLVTPSPIPWPAIAARVRSLAFPSGLALAILLIGYGLTEAWFRLREREITSTAHWSFRLPSDRAKFREIEILPRVRGELRFDEGRSGSWQDDAGRRWHAQYFQWAPGKNSAQMVAVHDPRACLSAAGMRRLATLPTLVFERGGVSLAFDAFRYLDGAQEVFIFNCLSEDVQRGGPQPALRSDNTIPSRFAAAFAGKRHLGQRRLEAAVWGETDPARAEAAFRKLLEAQIEVVEAAQRMD